MAYGSFNNETTVALTSAATFTGGTRDAGVSSGASCPFAYFNGFFYADQAGTASVECSVDGTNWFPCAITVLAASTPLLLSVPVMARYHRVKLVNGSTGQSTLMINSSYTGS